MPQLEQLVRRAERRERLGAFILLAVAGSVVAGIAILVPFDGRSPFGGLEVGLFAAGFVVLALADSAARLRPPRRQSGPLIVRRAPALSLASMSGWLLMSLALLLLVVDSPGFGRSSLRVVLATVPAVLIIASIPLATALRMARGGWREIQFSITEAGVSSLILLANDVHELAWSSIESLERIESGVGTSRAPTTVWRLNFRLVPPEDQPFAQAILGKLDLTRGGGCTHADILRAVALYRPQLIEAIILH